MVFINTRVWFIGYFLVKEEGESVRVQPSA